MPPTNQPANQSTNQPTNRPIKVLQLGSPTGLYGAERWILALIKHLDPQKVESIVGVIKDDPGQNAPLCQEAAKSGFRIHFFEGRGKINLSVIKQLKQFILQEEIDILHTHFYKTDIIGFLATRGTPCKTISTPHGWTQIPDFKLRIYEIIDRMIFSFFDAVAPLSENMLKPLERIPGLKKKIHLIRNAVDVTEVVSEKNIAEELVSWKNENTFIIGYIGRLITGKGLDILFHALAKLNGLKWKMAIIGEGEAENSLRDLSKRLAIFEKIHFFGFRADRISLLKGFDVFVLPSRSEGVPRCIMEAMAAKIPVIASDIPGSRLLITDNDTGLLFPLDSPSKLAQKIFLCAKNKQSNAKLTKNGFEFIMQNYSAQRMAAEYEILFEKIHLCP